MENLVFGPSMLQSWPTINSCRFVFYSNIKSYFYFDNYCLCIYREFLKDSLKELLKSDINFCQRENIETHFWRILYHNIIEQLKKLINEDSPELGKEYTTLLMNLIEEVCN